MFRTNCLKLTRQRRKTSKKNKFYSLGVALWQPPFNLNYMKAAGYIISILIVFVITACGENYREAIEIANNNMIEYPEKSLKILDSIKNYSGDFNQELSARFALLYSQALDKNYIDKTDDSLINIAVDYYSGRRVSEERLLSYYYRGRINQNSGKSQLAIIDFIRAEEDAVNLKNWFYAGMVNRGMAEIYSGAYNFNEQLSASKKSYEFFKMAGAESHANYALLDLGTAYNNNSKRDTSEIIYNRVIEIAQTQEQQYLLSDVLDRNGHLEFLQKDYSKAKSIWEYNRDSLSFRPNNWRKFQLAIASKRLGDMVSYNKYLNEIPKSALNNNISILALLAYEKLKDGDFEQSSTLYKHYADLKDSLFRRVMKQSVDAVQKQYYKNNYIIALDRLAVSRLMVVIVLIVTVLIIIYGVYRLWSNKKLENRYMEMIYEAKTELQNRFDKLQEKEIMINELFKSRFDLINELGDLHFEYRDSKKDKSIIYNNIKTKIEKLGSSAETLKELERIINKYNNNVAQLIKRDIPQIKDHDYRLYCYLCVGFTPQLIAVLLGKDLSIVYDRKYKLKRMIANKSQENRDILLKAIK